MRMLGKQLTAKPHASSWLHDFSSVLASVLKYHSVPYIVYNHYVSTKNKIDKNILETAVLYTLKWKILFPQKLIFLTWDSQRERKSNLQCKKSKAGIVTTQSQGTPHEPTGGGEYRDMSSQKWGWKCRSFRLMINGLECRWRSRGFILAVGRLQILRSWGWFSQKINLAAVCRESHQKAVTKPGHITCGNEDKGLVCYQATDTHWPGQAEDSFEVILS